MFYVYSKAFPVVFGRLNVSKQHTEKEKYCKLVIVTDVKESIRKGIYYTIEKHCI